VVASEEVLDGVLADVALVHELGVRVVLVVGCGAQVDAQLAARGLRSATVGGLRVTDPAAMAAVVSAAASVGVTVAAALSKGPPLPALRRHGEARRGSTSPATRVALGNFVAAKRTGVVGGADYGDTGEVRHVDAEAISARLNGGDIVLLSNLGCSAAGELLNCQTWEVAAHAAAQLKADKLICFARGGKGMVLNEAGEVVRWLPLREAEGLLAGASAAAAGGASDADSLAWRNRSQPPALSELQLQPGSLSNGGGGGAGGKGRRRAAGPAAAAAAPAPAPAAAAGGVWPLELAACVGACRAGVARCHVLDPSQEGSLLLELYTHDGVGTMVSLDQYEGTRPATLEDAPRIAKLLAPLEADGTLVRRSKKDLLADVAASRFTVVERDGQVVASAALRPYSDAAGGCSAELAAFAVEARYRGAGRGDDLLAFLERRAVSELGAKRLFLLTTRAADWFQARGFRAAGRAAGSAELPAGREVDAARNSLLFVKTLGES